jgi:hypothetical protein
MSKTKIVKLTFGCILFGILMTIDASLSQSWARVIISSCAGAVLGLILAETRH